MNTPEHKARDLRHRLGGLQGKGYSFVINADQFEVRYNGAFIEGAGVLLPREKPLHWRHAKANRAMFLADAVRVAESHWATLTPAVKTQVKE